MNMPTPLQSALHHARPIDAPIGVFDSGVGGLSVVCELQRVMPQEHFVYYADTAHVPYGDKSDQEILQLTANAVRFLFQQGCKAVVVACNTASAFSLTWLREQYGEFFPIIGLVPALKPAVLATQTKRVAVLATPGTLRGQLLNDVIETVAKPADVEVRTLISPKLVPFVEQGVMQSDACLSELRTILSPAVDQGCDQLVLGCTHYPFLAPAITSLYGDALQLKDSGYAVALQTQRRLLQLHILQSSAISSSPSSMHPVRCYVSGNAAQFMQTACRLVSFELAHVST